MIAVIKTGGKQYVVQEGDVLKIEKLAQNPGEQVAFEVLMTAEGANVQIAPKATISAEVIEQGRAAKVSVVKYKAKSRYTRRVGHRQPFTKVKIGSITA